MQALQFSAAAATFFLVGGAMAYYDWFRAKAGRPILGGRDSVQMYWITYLAMFTLAITCAAAAIFR